MSIPLELDFSGRKAPPQTLRQAVQCLVDAFPTPMTLYDVEVESQIRFGLRGTIIGATAAHLHAIADAARREDCLVVIEPGRELSAAPAAMGRVLEQLASDRKFLEDAVGQVADAMLLVGGSKAARDVLAERQRQIIQEGFNQAHDDSQNSPQELACAAAGYAMFSSAPASAVVMRPDACRQAGDQSVPICWPWAATDFKPRTWRRDTVRAAALLLAALELDDAQRMAVTGATA